jgi:hypothetical protein
MIQPSLAAFTETETRTEKLCGAELANFEHLPFLNGLLVADP